MSFYQMFFYQKHYKEKKNCHLSVKILICWTNITYSMNHIFFKSEIKLLSIMQTSYINYSRKDDLTSEK